MLTRRSTQGCVQDVETSRRVFLYTRSASNVLLLVTRIYWKCFKQKRQSVFQNEVVSKSL